MRQPADRCAGNLPTVAYHKDHSDAGTFGLGVPLLRDLHIGSEASEIDPRVPVLEKTT